MSIGIIGNVTKPQEADAIISKTNTSLESLCEETLSGQTRKFSVEGISNISDWGWADRNYNLFLITVEKYIAIAYITVKCVTSGGQISVKYAYYLNGNIIFTN